MADSRSVPTPKGLDSASRRFWKLVISKYDLRPDELILLESACRTMDTMAALDDAMAGQPLTTTGSMGQQREHPLLSEARQQRGLLLRMFAQLGLPDEVAGAKVNPQREGGMTRWARAHGQGA